MPPFEADDRPDCVWADHCHVIDVAPAVLEAAGLPEPVMVNGVLQSPIEGTSMHIRSTTPRPPERHDLQYFEMATNRGIYHQGWSAVTRRRTPWVTGEVKLPAFDEDVWVVAALREHRKRMLAEGHPLGHSQISVTLDIYSHVLPGMGKDAAERLDAFRVGRNAFGSLLCFGDVS